MGYGYMINDYSIQISENKSTQKAGDYSIQRAGDKSTQTAKNYSFQTALCNSIQTAGHNSIQTALYNSIQTAGSCSVQIASSYSTQHAAAGSVSVIRGRIGYCQHDGEVLQILVYRDVEKSKYIFLSKVISDKKKHKLEVVKEGKEGYKLKDTIIRQKR